MPCIVVGGWAIEFRLWGKVCSVWVGGSVVYIRLKCHIGLLDLKEFLIQFNLFTFSFIFSLFICK